MGFVRRGKIDDVKKYRNIGINKQYGKMNVRM